jgi:hypothetical protein
MVTRTVVKVDPPICMRTAVQQCQVKLKSDIMVTGLIETITTCKWCIHRWQGLNSVSLGTQEFVQT